MKVYAHDWECYIKIEGSWSQEEILSIQYPMTLYLCQLAQTWGYTPDITLRRMGITEKELRGRLCHLVEKYAACPTDRSEASADMGKIRSVSRALFPDAILEVVSSQDTGLIRYYTFDHLQGAALTLPRDLSADLHAEWAKHPRRTIGFCVVRDTFVCLGIEGYGLALSHHNTAQIQQLNTYALMNYQMNPPKLREVNTGKLNTLKQQSTCRRNRRK